MRRRPSDSIRKPIAIACLLAALGGMAPRAAAADAAPGALPISALADLVSDDVGLCIEADNFAQHTARFMVGPLHRRLKHFPPFARSVAENAPKIGLASGEFQRRLGASPLDVWNGILGGRALFAVWPPAEEDQNGPALLLIEAHEGELLNRVLDKFVALQRDAGKWQKSWTLARAGRQCTVHRIGSGDEQLYLTSFGKLGVAANSEALIQTALDLSSETGAARGPLSKLPGYVAGGRRLADETAIRVFVNPRPWDAGLRADLERKPIESKDAQFQKAVVETWRATEYVVAGLILDPDVALEGFAAWDTSALPAQVREAAESVSGRAALVDRVPADALAAVAGRVDFGRLVWRFGLPAPRFANAAEGHSGPAMVRPTSPEWLLPGSLARGIGPNFSAYLTTRATAAASAPESHMPLEWVAGLETRPLESGDGRPSLARLAEPLLHSALAAAVAATNAQAPRGAAASLETSDLDGVSITSVAGLAGPRGGPFAASYAVVEDHFWAASSPQAIRLALELPAENSLARTAQLRRIENPSQLAYLNLKGIRELLQTSPAVVQFLAASNGLDPEAAQRSFRELIALAQLADIAAGAARVDETGIAASLYFSAEDAVVEK
jgi:hypothetical protein